MYEQWYITRTKYNKEWIKNDQAQTYPKLCISKNANAFVDYCLIKCIDTKKDKSKRIQYKEIMVKPDKVGQKSIGQ